MFILPIITTLLASLPYQSKAREKCSCEVQADKFDLLHIDHRSQAAKQARGVGGVTVTRGKGMYGDTRPAGFGFIFRFPLTSVRWPKERFIDSVVDLARQTIDC